MRRPQDLSTGTSSGLWQGDYDKTKERVSVSYISKLNIPMSKTKSVDYNVSSEAPILNSLHDVGVLIEAFLVWKILKA